MRLAFFAIIILSNLTFFIYWLFKTFMEGRKMVLTKLGKAYMILHLCTDK